MDIRTRTDITVAVAVAEDSEEDTGEDTAVIINLEV
jgi:hypothetical protein